MGERRVAGTQDELVLHLGAQLFAQRRAHIDLGEDPKPCSFSAARARSAVSANGRSSRTVIP
jgi:hypothetical protein